MSPPRFVAKLLLLSMVVAPSALARNWSESKTASAYAEGAQRPYLPRGGTSVEHLTCEGSTTVLELVHTKATIPQHDVDLGRTRIILHAKADGVPSRDGGMAGGKVILDETLAEVWECLGFNPRTRRYVLTSTSELGVKVTLRGLVYLDENAVTFKDSVFGRRQVRAVSSLYQPTSGYLALVATAEGEHKRDTVRLYVLDTETDQLKALGNPPAPPPLDAQLRNDRQAIMMMWPWDSPECHYTEMDATIWSFVDASTLRVSYGRDTVKARAKRRTEKRWDLAQLFRTTP